MPLFPLCRVFLGPPAFLPPWSPRVVPLPPLFFTPPPSPVPIFYAPPVFYGPTHIVVSPKGAIFPPPNGDSFLRPQFPAGSPRVPQGLTSLCKRGNLQMVSPFKPPLFNKATPLYPCGFWDAHPSYLAHIGLNLSYPPSLKSPLHSLGLHSFYAISHLFLGLSYRLSLF